MQKISYIKLGEYIGSKASSYFGGYYSDEKNDCYNCSIELTEVNKPPINYKL